MWTGVRERVLALRTAPGAHRVFGASVGRFGHRFTLRPPLTEAELLETEEALGVRLPEEYRGFLLEVAAAGAGPDYGVLPLTRPKEGGAASAEHLRRPFRPVHVQELTTAHQAGKPLRRTYADPDEYVRDYHAWDERDDELFDALDEGSLRVSEHGCGYFTLLAVTGPERGTMWADVRATDEGAVPFRRPGKERMTFAEWYLRWLARAETRARGEAETATGSAAAP
ncbi:hypothetical protein GCM10022205_56850 [Spinactinospora alkalitolerans]